MTTAYAHSVHAQARKDIESTGALRSKTQAALEMLGYDHDMIAKLENDIKDRIYR